MFKLKNKLTIVFILLGIGNSIQLNAQVISTQILNGEQFYSTTSSTFDYDNDGDLDIIASRWDPAGIYVLVNNGAKQFNAEPIITENIDFQIADIDIADIDNDGDADLVVCLKDNNGSELACFQKQDDGTYQKFQIAQNMRYNMADVADFDNDGWVDIVSVGTGDTENNGRLYLNQTNLTFEEKIIAQYKVKTSVDAADIDNDGDIDIAFGGTGTIYGN
ncbi:MAG: hypothetical protein B6I20_08670, partial [Bacteroidetes bacterium 4572_117]